jgi:putative ABC transport system permease protein
MSPLLDATVFAPLRHAPGRTALLVVAIALGVALGLAIHLINRAAADEVSLAARSLYGLADLAVESADGLDEALYPRIARLPGVEVASPVVEVEAKFATRRGALTLIGVDAFRSAMMQPAFAAMTGTMSSEVGAALDPRAVYLSASAARELGLAAGDVLALQVGMERRDFTVAGVLPAAALTEHAGVLDIATAQWQFGRLGRLSRINLRLTPGANLRRVREALSRVLPPSARVITPGQAGEEAVQLSRAYRSNLTALALVALFTGGFFVYSSQSLATLRRRRELAILHALGVTRGQQLMLVLCGTALIGICGAVAGIALGVTIAKAGLQALGADLGAGYFRGLLVDLQVQPAEIAAFALLGVIVAVIGALRPALDAARVATASALKSGDVTSGELRTHGRIVIVLSVLATAVLLLPPIGGLPLQGYLSIALLLTSVIIAMPAIVRFVLERAPRSNATVYQIAIAQIAGAARYATLSVSAIIVSFSLMVSMAIMVTSFRSSLDEWTQKLLPADLYVRVGYVGQSAHIDEATMHAVAGLAGVERVQSSRFARVMLTPERPAVTLIARTLDHGGAARSLWLTRSSDAPAPDGAIEVWINEAAGDLFGLQPGGAFDLPLAGRTHPAFVRGLWRDYEHRNGAIVIERSTYIQLTGDREVNTFWLWLREGVSVQAIQAAIRDLLPPDVAYDLRTPPQLRALSLGAFDRTFAVTYLLELVAVLIGLFGIAAGISAQVFMRRGEFGALRFLGLTRGQVGAMLALEGIVLGTVGVVVGLATGGLVSLILIHVVNRQSFHWSMDLFVPAGLLGGLSLALVAAAALIAALSGRQAMSTDVVSAVKEDW